MAKSKRNRKNSNKSDISSARLDRIAGKVLSVLRASKDLHYVEIAKLKINTPIEDLYPLFTRIFRDHNYFESVYGYAFPCRLSELFSKPGLYKPADPFTEIIWAICLCLKFGEELRDFIKLREDYESSLLLNLKSECYEILNNIEVRFGHSIWLLQNRLAATQFWEGIEETRKLARSYEDECKGHGLMPSIIRFIGKRIEATGLKGYLKSELLQIFEGGSDPVLERYFRAKILDLPNLGTDDISATLFIEAQSCIIDYYDTLVFVLQSAARNQAIPAKMISTLEKPLIALSKRTQDSRLDGVLRGFGIVPITTIYYNEKRAELIEAYTSGEYELVARISDEYLSNSPEDMSIQVMRLKACIRIGIPYLSQQGVLKEAFESLHKVLSASEHTYSGAYDLFTLSERFYGHSWVHYLTSVVLYEIREEQATFPPYQLKDLFIREKYISPFSAVAANGLAKTKILNDEYLKRIFPYTRAVYDLVTTGKINQSLPISEIRKKKYLATFHLAFGNLIDASEHYQWLIENTTGREHIRSGGGATLAFLKLGQIREAVDATVKAYLENHNVPTILPIQQVTDVLQEPANWPDSISTPILFNLYATYCGRERLSQLIYAFELFQQNHGIQEPSDLAKRIDEFEKPLVISYLRNVWTPEIMRKTILYSGTKEIEEARIKVCRLLAELDSENTEYYLDEIRERVKQQEIAKGTTLIEQSKVYVEIEAIKKALKLKLGDSYARYKSSSQVSPSKPEKLIHKKITEVISNLAHEKGVSVPLMLSTVNSISPDIGSESDVQFEALFSEVTNEFLRGDHGLNAYLSTRVRHGTLSNTLRKPVADEHLITSREEGSSSYIRNQYWNEILESNGVYRAEVDSILDALDSFSSDFDNVIKYIKDELIQIKIIHELKDEGENRNALFVYRSSNIERKFIQEHDNAFTSMDDFVNFYIDILWEKTDRNLLKVQHVLTGEIRTRLMQPFVNLTNFLNQVSPLGVNDLLNAVARAKTNTQNKLALVISWFKRSEVYDRQDYAADFPFHIALNMVKNTMSNPAGWEDVSISTQRDSPLMPGRTLDGMVYVFHVLLENAVLRSGLDVEYLNVKADISFYDGIFNAKISNNLACTKVSEYEINKLNKLKESLKSDESPRRAQVEGRSGLHKIWLTINSPIYKDPKLDFYLVDNSSFVVDLSFKLEKTDNENTGH
jgi:hypothetical protein